MPKVAVLRPTSDYHAVMASRLCWNCDNHAHHTIMGDPFHTTTTPDDTNPLWFAPFRCDHCGYGTLAKMRVETTGDHTRLGVRLSEIRFSSSTYSSAALQRVVSILDSASENSDWLPVRSLGRRFDDVPEEIAAAASEAWACYSINQYRASVLMARAVVEAVAKQQGHSNGNLHSKIDALYNAQKIRPGVKDAAHEIRFLGNEMAHGDFVTKVGEHECADILNFVEVLLNEVYQQDAKLSRFKQQRLSNKTVQPEA